MKNSDDGTVLYGDEKCESNVAVLPNNKITLNQEVTPPYFNGKVRNVCQTLKVSYQMNSSTQAVAEGPIVNTTTNIYLFERSIWQLFEGSTMWDFEGATGGLKDFGYSCGTNVTTCSTVSAILIQY